MGQTTLGSSKRRNMLIKILLIYMAAISLCAFVMCIYDKRAAIKRRYRISEKSLFIVSILGGATGMFLGMLLVRHKTRHWYFMLFIPLFIIIHVVLIVTLL